MSSRPRPFLKWAGGKGKLLPRLEPLVPGRFGAYHEPFLGGGAFYFHLAAAGRITAAHLADINGPLVETYQAVQEEPEAVIAALEQHARRHGRQHYYAVRDARPEPGSRAARAARLIYLNRTCYNGLYRVNRAGRFNVPMGRYARPRICDPPRLRAASGALGGAVIARREFTEVLDHAREGDLVYLDPPYDPLPASSSFTSYHRDGFGPRQQEALREVFAALAARGAHVILSNSDTPRIRSLYRDFPCHEVTVARPINSRAGGRMPVPELIIHGTPAPG